MHKNFKTGARETFRGVDHPKSGAVPPRSIKICARAIKNWKTPGRDAIELHLDWSLSVNWFILARMIEPH